MVPSLAKRTASMQKSLIRQVFDSASKGAINLGLGQPAIDPHPAIMERLAKAARDNKAAYTPNAGDSELRARIAAEMFDGAPMESVIITIGSEEAMAAALFAVADAGDEIMAPTPGYPAYKSLCNLVGATHVTYELTMERSWRLDVDQLLAKVTPKTRAVIVTSPSNPTGCFAASPADMKRLVEALNERGVWVIDDCLYRDMSFTPHHEPLFRYGDNVLTIDAISKTYACTGLRVGWLHGPPSIEGKLVAINQSLVTTAPTPSQEATKTCLDLRKQGYLQEIAKLYAERARAAEEALRAEPRIRFAPSEGAFYIFADVRAFNIDERAMAFDLAKAGKVIVVPGEAFGPAGKGFLRITYAPEPAVIREGIGRLLAHLAG
jgi:aspartate aminotransferase